MNAERETLTQRELLSVLNRKPAPTTYEERLQRWCDTFASMVCLGNYTLAENALQNAFDDLWAGASG